MKKSYCHLDKDYFAYVDNLLKKKPKKRFKNIKPQKSLKERNQTMVNEVDNTYHKFLNYEFKG
jgi:hypothetical protein